MKRFACFIGIHTWLTAPAKYRNPMEEQLAIPEKRARRECEHCGKFQVRDEYCLGLNPPAYSYRWLDHD